jgi:4-hydroxybenzoate polyprenyltransferase
VIFLAGCGLEIVYCLMWKVTFSKPCQRRGENQTCRRRLRRSATSFSSVFVPLAVFLGNRRADIPNDWAEIEETRNFARTMLVQYGPAKASTIILVSLVFAVCLNLLLLRSRSSPDSYLAAFLLLACALLLPAYHFTSQERQNALTLSREQAIIHWLVSSW